MDFEKICFSSKAIDIAENDLYLEITNRLCYYDDKNLNNVMLPYKGFEESALENAKTLINMPVQAKYKKINNMDDLGSHEMHVLPTGEVEFLTESIGTHISVEINEDTVTTVSGETKILPCLFAKCRIWKRNSNMIAAVKRLYESDGGLNANATNIANSMTETAKKYGYSIQTNITDAWTHAGTAVTEYSNTFMQQSSGVITMIGSITDAWRQACEAAEKYAKATVSDTSDIYSSNINAGSNGSYKSNAFSQPINSINKNILQEVPLKGNPILNERQIEALNGFTMPMDGIKFNVNAPAIPQFTRNVQAPVYNIDNSITVDGVATNEIVRDMERVATKQAERVVGKMNQITYSKGVRR